MKLLEATTLILEAAKRMDEVYQQPVFDEFSIVQVEGEKLHLCWYRGEARQAYIRDFKQNTALLKKESRSRFTNHYETGAYEFVPDGLGPQVGDKPNRRRLRGHGGERDAGDEERGRKGGDFLPDDS